jgi:hypothetical protein
VYEAAVDGRSRASGARSAEPKRSAGNAVYVPVGQKIRSSGRCSRTGMPSRLYIRVRTGLLWRRTVLMFVETDDERKPSSCVRSLLDPRRNALLVCNLRGRSPP